jgi:hypothetical protein
MREGVLLLASKLRTIFMNKKTNSRAAETMLN